MSYAFECPLFCVPGLNASGDLSAAQFKFVTVNSSSQVAVAGTQGTVVVGVLQNKPSAAGQAAQVMSAGVTKVVAGATVAAGAVVESDSVGRAITAVKSTVNTGDAGSASDPVIGGAAAGIALTGGAVGELISVLLGPYSAVPTTAA